MMTPAAISKTMRTTPEEDPPEDPSSPEEAGTTAVVAVFWLFFSLPVDFFLALPPPVEEDAVVEVEVGAVAVEPLPPDDVCLPEEGTLGRYSDPDGAAMADVATTAASAAAMQRAVNVIRAVIEAMGGRRY
jgi:hypothetical protein